MSENVESVADEAAEAPANANEVKLKGLFLTKEGMSTVYNDVGEAINVTVLKYEPWIVSQVKTSGKEGYSAIQIACRPEKAKNGKKAGTGHFKAAGFENGARLAREIRQEASDDIQIGQRVLLESFEKGDTVRITARSKGRGFSGAMKRWGFGGGPASHGSGFHRKPGSIGNCEFPGRVMPGRKMPGQFGFENITVKNVKVVDVLTEQNVLLVKGPVPGGRRTLVKLMKE